MVRFATFNLAFDRTAPGMLGEELALTRTEQDALLARLADGNKRIGGLAVFGIGSMAISQLLWIVSVGRIGIGAASISPESDSSAARR